MGKIGKLYSNSS